MKQLPVYLLIILVVAAGVWLYMSQPKNKSTTSSQSVETPAFSGVTGIQEPMKIFTLTDIEKHSTKTDCWFAVEGKVYDVTKFIEGGKHPGKDAVIQGCGKDSTDLFNTRPMGSGTPHSDKARGFLVGYEIGKLE